MPIFAGREGTQHVFTFLFNFRSTYVGAWEVDEEISLCFDFSTASSLFETCLDICIPGNCFLTPSKIFLLPRTMKRQ